MANHSLRFTLASGQFDARYRRGAAIVALVLPLAFVALLIGGLTRNGLGSLATHPLLVASLPPGLAAMFLWAKRYSCPALTALRHLNKPVAVHGDCVSFFGRTFPLSEANSLLVEEKRISR